MGTANSDLVLPFQSSFDLSGSIEGALCVNLIDLVHEIDVLVADRNRLVVETGSGNVQELGLAGNRDIRVIFIDKAYPVMVI